MTHSGRLGPPGPTQNAGAHGTGRVSRGGSQEAPRRSVGDDACATYELPPDRMGDIVITSTENLTIGTSESEHDLSGLDAPLRSHGGLTEQEVPFIANRALPDLGSAPSLRNFDVLAVACTLAAMETA